MRNDSTGQGSFLRISLQGTESNRDAIGAEVTLYSATARTSRIRRMTVKSSLSYLSQCDRRLVFGLPADEKPRRLEIRWPRGRLEQLSVVPREGELLVVEGEAPEAQVAVQAAPPKPAAPSNSIVLRNRGRSLLESGRPAESLKELRSALRLDPHDFVAWRAVLVALEKLGRQEELQQLTTYKEDIERGILQSEEDIEFYENNKECNVCRQDIPEDFREKMIEHFHGKMHQLSLIHI